MQFRENSNKELKHILVKVVKLGNANGDNSQVFVNHMGEALLMLSGLVNHGFTENHLDHIINYCLSRVEYVLHLIEREEQEDAYQLATQTLRYYLKNSDSGVGGEVEL